MKDLLDYEKHLEFFFKSDEGSSLVDPVVKNPPRNGRGHGFDSWLEKYGPAGQGATKPMHRNC